MIYPTTGKNSKAWWLKLIEDKPELYSADLKTYINRSCGMSNMRIKEVFDHLILSNFVDMTGNGGRGGYKYVLTVMGKDYLENHPEEHEGPTRGALIDTSEVPKPIVGDKPVNKPVTVVQPLGHTTTEQEQTMIVKPEDAEYDPVANREIARKKAVLAEHNEGAAFAMAKANAAYRSRDLRTALSELLIERYGDEISAIELIEYMEKQR